MTAAPNDSSDLRLRALRALAANRAANLSFPGMFLDLAGRVLKNGELTLEFGEGAWCRDGKGETNLAVVGVLIDTALGGVTRSQAGPTLRPATVHLDVRFTGAPVHGHLMMRSHFDQWCTRTAVRQALPTGVLYSGDTPIAHASGIFALLDMPAGRTQATMPWDTRRLAATAPLETAALDEGERQVIKIFDRAAAAATAHRPFIEHFWCGDPKATNGKARLTVPISPHLGNRVNNVHAGVLLGMAAQVAAAAVPDSMRISNVSVWFLNPGTGPRLRVRSGVVNQGRNFAVVRTEILNATGGRVLEATTQHVRMG